MLNKRINRDKSLHAYIIGLALGDGNLSNPNGRAVRLRITCDKKYPKLLKHIKSSIQKVLPENRVSLINRKGCIDIACYSNYWESILGWKALGGSKYKQQVKIPDWVKGDKGFFKPCLQGLFQTDGSIYQDRGYKMVNFVSYIPNLAQDVYKLIIQLGHKPNIQKLKMTNGKTKHPIRISKNSDKFIKDINLWKK